MGKKKTKAKALAEAQTPAAPPSIALTNAWSEDLAPSIKELCRARGTPQQKQAAPPAPDPGGFSRLLWRFQTSCWHLKNNEKDAALRGYLVSSHEAVFDGETPPKGVGFEILTIKIGYELQRLGMKYGGIPDLRCTELWKANYKAAMALDAGALAGEFGEIVRLRIETEAVNREKRSAEMRARFEAIKDRKEKEGASMGSNEKTAKQQATKTTNIKAPKGKAPRITIASVVKAILEGVGVPADADVVASVQKQFPESAFKQTHLAWYKSKYRQGALSGMDGKPHVIAQKNDAPKAKKADVPKADAPAPKAKAKAKASKA